MSTKAMVCGYCGKTKEHVTFCIGASQKDTINPVTNELAWTMHEGTGKMSCDDRGCWEKGCSEAAAAIERLVRS